MMDISSEAKRVIAEKDYILDSANFYEISTDTIHITNEDFTNPLAIFTLLHEIAHRRQIVFLKLDGMDTPNLELDANRQAIAALMDFGIHISKRIKRILRQRIAK